jgi:predicted methyltransferase
MIVLRHLVTAAAVTLALAACKPEPKPQHVAPPAAAKPVTPPPAPPKPTGDLDLHWAIDGAWREADKARDDWRHPYETLQFFKLKPGQTVVEIWPGQGWYTQILAPYLARTRGQLIVAHFDPATAKTNPYVRSTLESYKAAFLVHPETYGTPTLSAMGAKTGPIAPPESADLVLTFRNVHNWINAGYADKAFKDMYAVLKPGGLLGVEEHRASPNKPEDPLAANGYVREATVKRLAKEAGFKYVGSSEINANPKDTKNHPFGVWTLPPVLRTAPEGQPDDLTFDQTKYKAIGESDRMTLLFRKPVPDKAKEPKSKTDSTAAKKHEAAKPDAKSKSTPVKDQKKKS